MIFTETKLRGAFIIEPSVFRDGRGFFMESWSRRAFEQAGLFYDFVQDNHSFTEKKGTLRGIHFQRGQMSQAKLVRCAAGAVLDVAVDLRPESETYGKWVAVELSAENKRQLLIPRRFGHGFISLTDGAEFLYKADNVYSPKHEGGIRWDDPALAIDWGARTCAVSPRDGALPLLADAVTDF